MFIVKRRKMKTAGAQPSAVKRPPKDVGQSKAD